MIRFTARGRSQVFSRYAGPFPGPTPIAGVPDEYAAFTIAEPPVARIRAMSL